MLVRGEGQRLIEQEKKVEAIVSGQALQWKLHHSVHCPCGRWRKWREEQRSNRANRANCLLQSHTLWEEGAVHCALQRRQQSPGTLVDICWTDEAKPLPSQGSIQTVQFCNNTAHSQHTSSWAAWRWWSPACPPCCCGPTWATWRCPCNAMSASSFPAFYPGYSATWHYHISQIPALEQHDEPGLSTVVAEEYQQPPDPPVLDLRLPRRSRRVCKRRHNCLDLNSLW